MPCAPQILVVEDDAAIRKLFAAVLAKDGYAVRSVETGRHAISVVRDRDFDLIILDIGLPDIDGLELITELRSERPHLKAVIVSGGVLPRAGTGGVVVALEKPLPARVLRQAVYTALDQSWCWLGTTSG